MKYILLLLSMLFLFSCESDIPEITITQCIDDEIDVFASQACIGSGDLTKWNFAGEDVFCFNEGDCFPDSEAYIYDVDCYLICILGGISGEQICDGLNWGSNAEYIGLIYQY